MKARDRIGVLMHLSELVRLALQEDVGGGDVTTEATIPASHHFQPRSLPSKTSLSLDTRSLVKCFLKWDVFTSLKSKGDC